MSPRTAVIDVGAMKETLDRLEAMPQPVTRRHRRRSDRDIAALLDATIDQMVIIVE